MSEIPESFQQLTQTSENEEAPDLNRRGFLGLASKAVVATGVVGVIASLPPFVQDALAYPVGGEDGFSQEKKENEFPKSICLAVEHIGQFHNYCGPAALAMVLNYFGFGTDQLRIGKEMQKLEVAGFPHFVGFDPRCVLNAVCASPYSLVGVAEKDYDVKMKSHQEWTFEDVYASLIRGCPVICDVNVDLVPGAFGYFVVIVGIDMENEIVYYQDSNRSRNKSLTTPNKSTTFKKFMASWSGPVDKRDPLQRQGHKAWAAAVIRDPYGNIVKANPVTREQTRFEQFLERRAKVRGWE